MTTKREIQERFNDINVSVEKDDEVKLKILIKMFGGVDGLWNAVHEDVTYLSIDADDQSKYGKAYVEDCLRSLEESYDCVMNDLVEREILDRDKEDVE